MNDDASMGEVQVVQFKNVKLLRLGVPNKNGTVYTKECVEKALAKMNNEEDKVIVHNVYAENPMPVGMIENLRIEGDLLMADCLFNPEFIKLIEGKTINVRPIGQGVFDENGKLEDYTISGLTVVYQPQ